MSSMDYIYPHHNFHYDLYPANIYLFKVNNRKTEKSVKHVQS